MRLGYKLAALGIGTAMLGAFGGPALAASSGVSVTLSTAGPNGGRTLVLQDKKGSPLSSLDMSSGTSSFIAKVVDSNYVNNGYTVQATMSNLYGFNSGTSTFNCAQKVASSAVALSSPSGLLDLSGISAGLTPNFVMSGTLTSLINPLLAGVTINNTVQGLAQSLTQAQLLGAGNTGNLFGSTLTGLLTKLPIGVTTPAGGPFTTPAADPAGASCGVTGSGATNVPVMSGTANGSGLLADLQSVITSALGASPTITQLINAGYLDPNAVAASLESDLSSLLPLSTIDSLLGSIESSLSGTLSSVTPLVSGLTGQSGTYSSSPDLAVNTAGVPTGSYKGLMTVTLVDS